MDEWELRLAHDKQLREGYILCGNPRPTKPDPMNGMVWVYPKLFNGKIFWDHMQKTGHTSQDFMACDCRKESK